MGSHTSHRYEIVGNNQVEKSKVLDHLRVIEAKLDNTTDPWLADNEGKWSGFQKWYPGDIFRRGSLVCVNTYILVQSVSSDYDDYPFWESIYFRGESLNALDSKFRRNPPISAIKSHLRTQEKNK